VATLFDEYDRLLCQVCDPPRPFGFNQLRGRDRCGNAGHVGKRRGACRHCKREDAAINTRGYCDECRIIGPSDRERARSDPAPVLVIDAATGTVVEHEHGYPSPRGHQPRIVPPFSEGSEK
jgi:hypothetical protein